MSAAGTSSDNPSASESRPFLGIGPALPVCSLLSLVLIAYICILAFFPEVLPERPPVNTVRVAVSQNGKPDDKTGAVLVPLTADSRIKAYYAWGDEAVNRLNSLLPKAAEMAAATPDCDSAEWAELSDFRSRPPEKAVFFVKCRNGRAVFVPEEDLIVAFDR